MTTVKPPPPLHPDLSALIADHAAKARNSDSGGKWLAIEGFKACAQEKCYELKLGPREYAAAVKAYERAMKGK